MMLNRYKMDPIFIQYIFCMDYLHIAHVVSSVILATTCFDFKLVSLFILLSAGDRLIVIHIIFPILTLLSESVFFKVMEVLMSLQGSQMENDDPTTSYMLQVCLYLSFWY